MFLRYLYVFFLILFIGLTTCAKQDDDQSGLEGTVFRGPIHPVAIPGQVNDEPFSALFHVVDMEQQAVASFQSEEDGTFLVNLAPGAYLVLPDEGAPLMNPTYQSKDVIVEPGKVTKQDMYFDTGIR